MEGVIHIKKYLQIITILKDFTNITLEVKDMHQRPLVKCDKYFLTGWGMYVLKLELSIPFWERAIGIRLEIISPSSCFTYKTAQKMSCSSVIK